jgi:HSP20 family protein
MYDTWNYKLIEYLCMNIFSRFTSNKDEEEYEEDMMEEVEVKKPAKAKVYEEDEVGELSVDMYETAKEIILESMIAGVKPEDLHIATTHNSITISGKREANTHIKQDDYIVQELYWGQFSRTVELPNDIAVDDAEAVEKHGLLIVRLPKIDKDRNVKVRVKSI